MATVNNTGTSYAAVTKSDTTIVGALALYVGTGGDVTIQASPTSSPVTFKSVPSGTYMPVRAHFVMLTGTTAADIVGIF